MNLKTYLEEKESAASFAEKIGVTPGFISQWRTGLRPVPLERCAQIERITEGAVTRRDLRPEDWHLIWPELVTKKFRAPRQQAAA